MCPKSHSHVAIGDVIAETANYLIPLPKRIWPKLMVRAETAEYLEITQ